MRDLKNCSLLVALCLIKLLNVICSKPQMEAHVFFHSWKSIGRIYEFFALHVPNFDKYNGVFFLIKTQNLKFLFEIPIIILVIPQFS